MVRKRDTLELNIFEQFRSISDGDIEKINIFQKLKDGVALLTIRRLFEFRLSLANTNSGEISCPHIAHVIKMFCDLNVSLKEDGYKNEIMLEDVYHKILTDGCQSLNEYISKNLPSIEYDLAIAFYIFSSNKIISVNNAIDNNVEIKSEVQKYRDEIKEIYAETGVHWFATKYSKIARSESCAKSAWLSISCVLFIVIIGVVALFSHSIIDLKEKTYLNLLFLYAERLPIIAILLVFFVWISKRYTISREKELVYRHLSTTLHVFKAFYKTAEPNHKSLVLLEAAKTLFPAPIDKNVDKSADCGELLNIIGKLSKSITKQEGNS